MLVVRVITGVATAFGDSNINWRCDIGSGSWDTSVYDAAASYRARTGKSAFDYDATAKASGLFKAHADLDPMGIAMRESRDSDEHPNSLANVILFDVTGSMAGVPPVLVDKLKAVFGLLLRKGYVEDPQILFGAIGDSHTDRVPLQVAQFESDNRMDQHLGNIFLEGGGGGGNHEGYEIALYFLARHTSIDCFEKRGKRGYAFLIGDEKAYPAVTPANVKKIFGEDIPQAISFADILAEAQRLYEVFYIIPEGTSHWGDTETLDFWKGALGENCIELSDLGAAAETIALTIGMREGAIDLTGGLADLVDVGSDAGAVVGKALTTLGTKSGRVSKATAPADLAAAVDSVTRL